MENFIPDENHHNILRTKNVREMAMEINSAGDVLWIDLHGELGIVRITAAGSKLVAVRRDDADPVAD